MEFFCDLIAILIPFSILTSLVYILYLIVLNKFNETKREFYSSTLVELSQEGREWFDLVMKNVDSISNVKKEASESSFTSAAPLMVGILPVLSSMVNTLFKPSNDDQVVNLLKQLIQQTNANHAGLSSQLLDIAENLPQTVKEEEKKVEVKAEATN